MTSVYDTVIEFLKSVEDVRLAAYLDNRGIITIGVGLARTYLDGKLIQINDKCTLEQAEDWLNQYLNKFVYPYINYLKSKYNFNDSIYVSLSSLIYNIGWHTVGQSIFSALANNSITQLADAFLRYDKIRNSKGDYLVCDGLLNRRKKEVGNFINSGDFNE